VNVVSPAARTAALGGVLVLTAVAVPDDLTQAAHTLSYTAPDKTFFHSDAPIDEAGGVLANSVRGTRAAAKAGFRWIDQDGHLTYATKTDLLAGPRRIAGPGSLRWVNAHGAPFEPSWLTTDRFETRTWPSIAGRPGVRDAESAFTEDAADGLSVEWEVKGVRPLSTPRTLDAAFANLAAVARRAYGPGWPGRVQVKVLSNLSGGLAFALRVLRFARAHGFTTILLARGRATRKRIPVHAQRYVTYVRGARAGLYASPPTTLVTTTESSS
jgi:hypothetical protein